MKSSFQLVCFLLFTVAAACQTSKKIPVFSDKNGAIRGFDPVAYFQKGAPMKGEKDLSFDWQGAIWHFANAENRRLFSENPTMYAPQYGGFCAYGLAQGNEVKIEPEAWSIVDGKLYLNYDLEVQKKWDAARADFIKTADKNWQAAHPGK